MSSCQPETIIIWIWGGHPCGRGRACGKKPRALSWATAPRRAPSPLSRSLSKQGALDSQVVSLKISIQIQIPVAIILEIFKVEVAFSFADSFPVALEASKELSDARSELGLSRKCFSFDELVGVFASGCLSLAAVCHAHWSVQRLFGSPNASSSVFSAVLRGRCPFSDITDDCATAPSGSCPCTRSPPATRVRGDDAFGSITLSRAGSVRLLAAVHSAS